MKNHSTNQNGQRFYRDDFVQFVEPSRATMDSVVCTPSVPTQGDFHTPNNWTYDTSFRLCWHGLYRRVFRSTGALYSTTNGFFGSNSDVPKLVTFETDAAYNLALERLNEAVRGKLDLGVDIVEARQTARMVKSLNRVVSFAKQTRYGRLLYVLQKKMIPPSQAKALVAKLGEIRKDPSIAFIGSTRHLAQGWLEWQYGWRPLMQDVFDVTDEIYRYNINRKLRVKGSSTVKRHITTRDDAVIDGFITSVALNGDERVKVKFVIDLEFNETERNRLDRFSSLNPISLGWEVIPYSFVVDWFVDIGSYLRNLETAFLYATNFKSGFVTTFGKYVSKADVLAKVTKLGDGTDILWEDCSCSVTQLMCHRQVLNSYPLPHLPQLEVHLGWERLLSAASLLRVLLK